MKRRERRVTRFVQICPNDGPPFLDLCRIYAKAAAKLGLAPTTVFLGPSRVEPVPEGNHYLDAVDLRATGALAGKLRSLVSDCQDSLVLCHRYRSYRVFSRSRLKAARVIALAHEHGFFRRRRRRIGRLLFGRDVLFAGVSPTIVEELQRAVGTALHLPNAVDADALEWSSRATARSELGLPPDGVCIGVIGRLHYKKNPELALDAFRPFFERHGPAHLAVVGDGDLRPELEARAEGLPVTFTGFVRDPRRLYRAFDAVLLTSGAPAFPNMVALEAMAAGVPVVAPRLPDAVGVLGDAGFYFDRHGIEPVAAALRRAVASEASPVSWERLGDKFSVDAVARRLRRLLAR